MDAPTVSTLEAPAKPVFLATAALTPVSRPQETSSMPVEVLPFAQVVPSFEVMESCCVHDIHQSFEFGCSNLNTSKCPAQDPCSCCECSPGRNDDVPASPADRMATFLILPLLDSRTTCAIAFPTRVQETQSVHEHQRTIQRPLRLTVPPGLGSKR